MEVLPVPGGPYNNKCGSLAVEFAFFGKMNLSSVVTMSVCEIKSSSLFGRYFSTHGTADFVTFTRGFVVGWTVGG